MVELRRSPLLSVVLAIAGLAIAASPLVAQVPRPFAVSYLSSNAVYLDGGRADGLTVGARLRVERSGEAIAELEVEYVADHSASCRVVSQRAEPQPGDRVVLVSLPEGTEPAPPTPEPVPPPTAPREAPQVLTPTPQEPDSGRVLRFRSSGSASFGFRTFNDDLGPSSEETTGRVSLRLRNLGGRPLDLRLRARSREITRDGYGPSVATSQSSDRLYELSLAWVPVEGRVHFHLGRLGYGPYPAIGNLDGLLGEVRLGRRFWVGAFGGSRPELGDLGFETGGEKYGAFARFDHERTGGPGFAELFLGGIIENDDGGEVSREYAALEGRFGSGSRWWFSARTEVDLNRDWREEVSGKSSQVTLASVAGSFRLSPTLRARLSYNQRRPLLTAETRPRPEEVFTDYLREGGRASLEWRTKANWSGSLGVGSERADNLDDSTESVFASIYKTRLFGTRFAAGADASSYSGGTAEGWVASLRGHYTFAAGHDVGLTIGASSTDIGADALLPTRDNQWARLSATVELPGNLWLYGEYELMTGDDLEGDRAVVEVGYRF